MACLQNRLIIVPSSISLYLFSLLLFSQTHICMSSRTRTKRPTLNLNLNLNLPIADIHDLLPEYGFPKGIIPNAVKSYSLSSVDGSFEIELEQPCYVQFDKDELIYYDKNIKGVLSYGSVSHVSGIQAKQLFLWVSVTGMDVDFNKGMIQVHVGPLSKNLPANQFQDIPNCINKASPHSSTLIQSEGRRLIEERKKKKRRKNRGNAAQKRRKGEEEERNRSSETYLGLSIVCFSRSSSTRDRVLRVFDRLFDQIRLAI